MSEFEPGTETPQGEPPRDAAAPAAEAPATERAMAAAPPPRSKSRVPAFLIGTFSGCALAVIALFIIGAFAVSMHNSSGDSVSFGDKVAIVPLDGEIRDSRETVDAIHKYADSSSVRAIVIRINSPGGAIAPSQEINEEIRKTRKRTGKPIVASLDSVAASGGYYVAVACDRIVANPGSITGSIGVILEWMDVKDLLTWAKLKPETITSGAMKAAGSPYRDLSDAERSYFQRIVTQLHGQFVKAVAVGRNGKISEADVSRIADGRVFTGEEALGLKLIDELGNLDDAVTAAGKLAGVKGRPGTLYPKKRKGGFIDLFNSDDTETVIERVLARPAMRFLYRW